MLLTRSPLSPVPKDWFSLDLHVLSAPPAFVLSQDQTLREEMCVIADRSRQATLHLELELKGRSPLTEEEADGLLLSLDPQPAEDASRSRR